MEMQLSRLILISLFFLLSCKNDAQENKIISPKKELHNVKSINFFDKKYASDYTMIVDESTLADHPIQTFLDCKDSYFTIHYIPKKQELKDFWNIKYFQNRNIDNIDFKNESKYIEEKIKNEINDYAIFCYYVPSKYIKSNNGCTIESIYLDENTLANIYYFNNQSKNWLLIKQEKSGHLPRIIEAEYFTSNFLTYFNQKDVETKAIESTNPKITSIFNSWVNDDDIPEIHINRNQINYLFHGQCVYSFPVKILNENEVELVWGYKGRDCVYDVLFDETFNLPKGKIPQKGKPFSKYTIENNTIKVTYYYNEWLEKYRKKMKENDKPFPFLKSFSLKKE